MMYRFYMKPGYSEAITLRKVKISEIEASYRFFLTSQIYPLAQLKEIFHISACQSPAAFVKG
jgi:hypothetical protein